MLAAVAAACESGAVARPVRLRVELVVEELVSNTLNHGYRGSAEGKGIWMDVSFDGKGLRLRYQDEGPPFNPLESGPGIAEEAIRAGRAGGLGGALIGTLPIEARYARSGGRNTLELHFPLT